MGDPDDALLRTVGARVAELRRERGWTQDGLAQRLGVGTKYVQRVEQGTENLTLRTVGRLAAELGVAPLVLMLPPLSARRPSSGRPAAKDAAPRVGVRRVAPRPGAVGVIPLYTLRAAAGAEARADLAEVGEWVAIDGVKTSPDSFVMRVDGDSMAPLIPDGCLALFRRAIHPPNGRVLLVELSEGDALPHYLVKRVVIDPPSVRAQGRTFATLLSENEAYGPRRVDLSPEGGVRLVGEFQAVVAAAR